MFWISFIDSITQLWTRSIFGSSQFFFGCLWLFSDIFCFQQQIKDRITFLEWSPPTLFWHSFWHTIWKYIMQAYILTFYLTLFLDISGIYSDILSDILSGILCGIYSDILSGMQSGIYSDILSGIYSGIFSGILSGIDSDVYPDILFGILSGMCSGPGVAHCIRSGFLYGVRVQAPTVPRYPDSDLAGGELPIQGRGFFWVSHLAHRKRSLWPRL